MSQTNPECDDHQVAYLEGEEEAAVHVRSCDICQRLVAELDTVRALLPTPPPGPNPILASRTRSLPP